MSRKSRRELEYFAKPLYDSPTKPEMPDDDDPLNMKRFYAPRPAKQEMLSTVFTPPAPTIDIGGHWRASSGSILCFRKPEQSRFIWVKGDAFDQKVHGQGSIDGDKITIRLTLLADEKELDLDLWIALEGSLKGDLISGSFRGDDGIVRDFSLHRFAPDVEGTWEENGATFLSFSNIRLDWYDGKQQVRADVTGSVFGRSGEGVFDLSGFQGRSIFGKLESTDDSHREQYGGSLLNPHSEKWYIRECPKEGWWAANSVYLHLTMSSDGRLLDGTVKPGLLRSRERIDEEPKREAIKEHLHMRRRPRDLPRERSL
jgi:hypothetical protein